MNRTAKTLILASGQGTTALVSLLIAGILSRLFDKTEYGTYRQVLLVYQFAAPLLILGLPQALFYFLPTANKRLRGILLENLLLLGSTGLLFSLFLACGGNHWIASRFNNPALVQALLVFSPYPVLFLPTMSVAAVLVTQDKHLRSAVFMTVSRLFTLVFVVGAAFYFRTVIAAVAATVLAAAVVLGPALWLMWNAVPPSSARVTKAGVVEQLKYSVPLGLGGMLGTISLGMGKILVSAMRSTEEFAVFSNGAIEIPLIYMITGSAAAVILPEMTKYFQSGNPEAALGLWQRAGVKSALILLPVAALLYVLAPEVMTILYSKAYIGSAVVFQVFLLLLPVRVIQFGVMFQSMGRSDQVLIRSMVSLPMHVVFSYVLIQRFGIVGAAVGPVIVVYLISMGWNLVWICRQCSVKYSKVLPWGRFGQIAVVCALATMVAFPVKYFFGGLPSIAIVAMYGSVFGLAYLLLLKLIGISVIDEIRNIVSIKNTNSK